MGYEIITTGNVPLVDLQGLGIDPIPHPSTLDLLSFGLSFEEISSSSDLQRAILDQEVVVDYNGSIIDNTVLESSSDPSIALLTETFQIKSEKDQPDGFPGLDSSGHIIDSQIPSTIPRDTDLSNHINDNDLHLTSQQNSDLDGDKFLHRENDSLDDIPEGSTYSKVKTDSLTSGEVDHTKILNKNAETNIKHVTDDVLASAENSPNSLAAGNPISDKSYTDSQDNSLQLQISSNDIDISTLQSGKVDKSGSISDITSRNHSDLQNKNDESDIKHITDDHLGALNSSTNSLTSSNPIVDKLEFDTAIDNLQSEIGGRLLPPVQDISSLKAIDTTIEADYKDKTLCNVEDNGLYRLDRQSTETEDLDRIIQPTTGPGRWLKMTTSISDHNLLSVIQGGSASERYHLLATQHSSLTGGFSSDADTYHTHNLKVDKSGSLDQISLRNHSDLQNKNLESNVKHLTDSLLASLENAPNNLTAVNPVTDKSYSDTQDSALQSQITSNDGDISTLQLGKADSVHTHIPLEVGLNNVTDDAQLKREANDFSPFGEKVNTVPSDRILVEDSEDSFNKVWSSISSIAAGSANVFHAYDAGGNLDITSGFQDVLLDTEVKKDSFTHLNDSAEITFTVSGWYLVLYYCGTTGGGRADSMSRLQQDLGSGYVDIPGTDLFMYNRLASIGKNSAAATIVRPFSTGDKIKIIAKKNAGSGNIFTVANGVGISIVQIINAVDGSGVSNFGELSDVVLSSLVDKQIASFDFSTNQWKNVTLDSSYISDFDEKISENRDLIRNTKDVMINSLKISTLNLSEAYGKNSFFVDSFNNIDFIDVESVNYYLDPNDSWIGLNPGGNSTFVDTTQSNFDLGDFGSNTSESFSDFGGDGSIRKRRTIEGSILSLEDFEDLSNISGVGSVSVYQSNASGTFIEGSKSLRAHIDFSAVSLTETGDVLIDLGAGGVDLSSYKFLRFSFLKLEGNLFDYTLAVIDTASATYSYTQQPLDQGISFQEVSVSLIDSFTTIDETSIRYIRLRFTELASQRFLHITGTTFAQFAISATAKGWQTFRVTEDVECRRVRIHARYSGAVPNSPLNVAVTDVFGTTRGIAVVQPGDASTTWQEFYLTFDNIFDLKAGFDYQFKVESFSTNQWQIRTFTNAGYAGGTFWEDNGGFFDPTNTNDDLDFSLYKPAVIEDIYIDKVEAEAESTYIQNATYTSRNIDLGLTPSSLDSLYWDLVGSSDTVTVRIKFAATELGLPVAPWNGPYSDPTGTGNNLTGITQQRWMQYEVSWALGTTQDSDSIKSLKLNYSLPVGQGTATVISKVVALQSDPEDFIFYFAEKEREGSIDYSISRDGKATFQSVPRSQKGVLVLFSSGTGSSLHLKAVITGNSQLYGWSVIPDTEPIS